MRTLILIVSVAFAAGGFAQPASGPSPKPAKKKQPSLFCQVLGAAVVSADKGFLPLRGEAVKGGILLSKDLEENFRSKVWLPGAEGALIVLRKVKKTQEWSTTVHVDPSPAKAKARYARLVEDIQRCKFNWAGSRAYPKQGPLETTAWIFPERNVVIEARITERAVARPGAEAGDREQHVSAHVTHGLLNGGK